MLAMSIALSFGFARWAAPKRSESSAAAGQNPMPVANVKRGYPR